MWIAFKNLIFDYWTQRNVRICCCLGSCELLSKILSLTIEHNEWAGVTTRPTVVNCFQKSYLWLLNTTSYLGVVVSSLLWIAFKNLIFDYWTQHPRLAKRSASVVNCFQKSYLWLLNTTHSLLRRTWPWLWIAFKNLIFDYWTQRLLGKFNSLCRCELLSKILSLTIEHNRRCVRWLITHVVNCFQKSYLWLLNTTLNLRSRSNCTLWIAFKNLIFDYWTQRFFVID